MPLIRKRRSKSSTGALLVSSGIVESTSDFLTRVEADGGYIEGLACVWLSIISFPPSGTP